MPLRLIGLVLRPHNDVSRFMITVRPTACDGEHASLKPSTRERRLAVRLRMSCPERNAFSWHDEQRHLWQQFVRHLGQDFAFDIVCSCRIRALRLVDKYGMPREYREAAFGFEFRDARVNGACPHLKIAGSKYRMMVTACQSRWPLASPIMKKKRGRQVAGEALPTSLRKRRT